MNRYILRRLAVIPLGLLLATFAGFAYAHLVRPVQLANNPMFAVSTRPPPLLPAYFEYLKGLPQLDFGLLPPAGADIGTLVLSSTIASLGLLTLALLISVLLGAALGIKAVRTEPTRIAPWLTGFTTIGLAMPGFYVGSLLIMAVLFYLVYGPTSFPIPVQGFGGVSPLGTGVLIYGSQFDDLRVVQLGIDGRLMTNLHWGQKNPRLVATDLADRADVCGTSNDGMAECIAVQPGDSGEPSWRVRMEKGGVQFAGAALVPGRLYINTQEGWLYAVGD